jgi:hypothetical protein
MWQALALANISVVTVNLCSLLKDGRKLLASFQHPVTASEQKTNMLFQ